MHIYTHIDIDIDIDERHTHRHIYRYINLTYLYYTDAGLNDVCITILPAAGKHLKPACTGSLRPHTLVA
jgi:hypothetical protein